MYDIKYVEGTLTINPAEATIVVPDITKVYGEPDPEKVATVEGLIDPDSIPDEDLKVGRKTSPRYEAGGRTYLDELIPAHGTYPDWYNEHYPNYTFTIDMGDLTISEREVTVSVADKTVDYNNAEQTATITYTASKGTDAGTYTNGAFKEDSFKVIDANGNDVTSSYKLTTKTAGKLTSLRSLMLTRQQRRE